MSSSKVNVGTIIASLKKAGQLAHDQQDRAWWLPWCESVDPYAADPSEWAQPVPVKSDLFRRILSRALNGTHIAAKLAKEIQDMVTDEAFRGRSITAAEWWVYDHGAKTLRVAISNSHVVVIGPAGFNLERNGATFVFTLPRNFEPLSYADVFQWMHPAAPRMNAMRSCLTGDLPPAMLTNWLNADSDSCWTTEEQIAIIHAWWLGMFLGQAVQGRPILGLIGQKGSGKSVTARLLGQLFYGPEFEVSGSVGGSRAVKDLVATAVHTPFTVADDQNNVPRDIVDIMCRIATGSQVDLATMHETLELSRFKPRAGVCITANRPGWALRDDLMDRMLPVAISSPGESQLTEVDRSYRVQQWRTAVWGETLYSLYHALVSDVVWSCCTRFTSWETCVRRIADAGEWHDTLHSALRKAKTQRVAMSCWADQFVSAIFSVATEALKDSRYFTAAELYDAITARMGGKVHVSDGERPSSVALRNPIALGKFLSNLNESGSTVVDVLRGPDVNGTATWAIMPKVEV